MDICTNDVDDVDNDRFLLLSMPHDAFTLAWYTLENSVSSLLQRVL